MTVEMDHELDGQPPHEGHDRDHGGHDGDHHDHQYGRGLGQLWRVFIAPHSHDAKDSIDRELESSSDGIRAVAVTQRSQVVPTVEMTRKHKGPVLIDFQVEQEDSVYPMVPAGASLTDMIRRPDNPLVETATEQ